MSHKFTKGPWVLDTGDLDTEIGGVCAWVRNAENNEPCFAVACCDSGKLSTSENIANARLIAAAPDLLEALKKAYADATYFLNYGTFNGANFSTANASCVDGRVEWDVGYIVDAIAKATGGDE